VTSPSAVNLYNVEVPDRVADTVSLSLRNKVELED